MDDVIRLDGILFRIVSCASPCETSRPMFERTYFRHFFHRWRVVPLASKTSVVEKTTSAKLSKCVVPAYSMRIIERISVAFKGNPFITANGLCIGYSTSTRKLSFWILCHNLEYGTNTNVVPPSPSVGWDSVSCILLLWDPG